MDHDNEAVPYRSPVKLDPRVRQSVADERDFSTLKILLKLIDEAEAKARDNTTLDSSNKDVTLTEQLHGLNWALNELILPFRNAVFNAVNTQEANQRGEEA